MVYGWHGPLSHSHILFGGFQLLIIYLNKTHWLVGNVTLLKMYLKLKSYKIWHLKKNVFIITVTSHEILFYHRLQCLCNRLSRLTTNKTSKLGIAGFLGEESTCRFPSQRASNTETVSMSWHLLCNRMFWWIFDTPKSMPNFVKAINYILKARDHLYRTHIYQHLTPSLFNYRHTGAAVKFIIIDF